MGSTSSKTTKAQGTTSTATVISINSRTQSNAGSSQTVTQPGTQHNASTSRHVATEPSYYQQTCYRPTSSQPSYQSPVIKAASTQPDLKKALPRQLPYQTNANDEFSGFVTRHEWGTQPLRSVPRPTVTQTLDQRTAKRPTATQPDLKQANYCQPEPAAKDYWVAQRAQPFHTEPRPTSTLSLNQQTVLRPAVTHPLQQQTVSRPTTSTHLLTQQTRPTFNHLSTDQTVTKPTKTQSLIQPTVKRPATTQPLTQQTLTRPAASDLSTQQTITRPTPAAAQPLIQPTVTRPTTSQLLTQQTATRPTASQALNQRTAPKPTATAANNPNETPKPATASTAKTTIEFRSRSRRVKPSTVESREVTPSSTKNPIVPGNSEVLIIGDCIIRDIRKYLPSEYKVFFYGNATIKEVTDRVRKAEVAGHVLQVALHAGTFDLKQDMRIKDDDYLSADEMYATEIKAITNDMRELIRFAHEKFPSATIFISALLERKSINREIFEAVNDKLRALTEGINRDLRGQLEVKFFNGGVDIPPWRRVKDGIHLPEELGQEFASNIKALLSHYRPLKGVMVEQKIEPEIRVGDANQIIIGDCVVKDLRRFLPKNYRVFWYKDGKIDKLKEKVIEIQPAPRVEGVILHVGTFDLKGFESSFDDMMDQTIELILIALDRFPQAKVRISKIFPRADKSLNALVRRVNEFYSRLCNAMGDRGRFDLFDAKTIDLLSLEPDGIHLIKDHARYLAVAVTNACM